jgi:aspartate-semialdehyde dehydrogenase
MIQDTYGVAIVGAAGLPGRELLVVLEQRAFPVGTLRLLDAEPGVAGEGAEFAGGVIEIEPLGEELSGVDIVFLVGGAHPDPDQLDSLLRSGALLIDGSGRWALDDEVPLVVPECNPSALAGHRARGIVASPDPVAIALSVLLAPLQEAFGVRRVVATALEPVSRAGAAGIDELSRQTIDLMSGRSVEPVVFASRVGFNVFPGIGPLGEGGDTEDEAAVTAQVRKILGTDGLGVRVTRLGVPTFYGLGISANVELEAGATMGEVHDLLRRSPGLLVDSAAEGVGSLADAVGQDGTLVSRVRTDGSVPSGLDCWVAIDNLRKGQAVNAVQIAEILVRDYI